MTGLHLPTTCVNGELEIIIYDHRWALVSNYPVHGRKLNIYTQNSNQWDQTDFWMTRDGLIWWREYSGGHSAINPPPSHKSRPILILKMMRQTAAIKGKLYELCVTNNCLMVFENGLTCSVVADHGGKD